MSGIQTASLGSAGLGFGGGFLLFPREHDDNSHGGNFPSAFVSCECLAQTFPEFIDGS